MRNGSGVDDPALRQQLKTGIDDWLRGKLGAAADVIETVTWNAGVPCEITDVVVLGDYVRFLGTPLRLGERDALDNWKALRGTALRISFELGLPEKHDVSVGRGAGVIIFEAALSDLVGNGDRYFIPLRLSDLDVAESQVMVPIGKRMDSSVFYYMPGSPEHSHVVLLGQTGCGKTCMANAILYQMARLFGPEEWGLLLASGKYEDVRPWAGLPHLLAEPTVEPEQTIAMLEWVAGERKRRDVVGSGSKRLITVCIGEVAQLVMVAENRLTELLELLARMGRSSRISLLLVAQRGTGSQLGSTLVKSQMVCRLSGAQGDVLDSYLAVGHGGSGAHMLPGMGAWLCGNDRFQGLFVDPVEIMALVRQLELQYPTYPRYVDLGVTQRPLRREPEDLLLILEWLDRNAAGETSISELQSVMGWGYPRVKRVWTELVDAGLIADRRGGAAAKTEVDLGMVRNRLGGGK